MEEQSRAGLNGGRESASGANLRIDIMRITT